GWVYILTNKPNGTLCTGVTNDLSRRMWEHREEVAGGFTKLYGLKRLVWMEHHADIIHAVQREKNLKHWSRAWKIDLIIKSNPDWQDLYERLAWSWMAGSSPAMTKRRVFKLSPLPRK